ncbi:hypothetical protein [Microvirga sp. VF16]|uniref:hypothetical protein n=1 Tax=Microvirga sp. VF16 TaxID=2807101 RepID=UPI00193E118F|nr:hypothetical protein [Microvirga sp. VF16]QRM34787.1 hypothetical protein JO965_41735 [Microvirga sp. VF16]
MANVLSRIILFLSSYIPLWIIFAVMTLRERPYLGSIFIGLAILSLLGTLLYMRLVQRLQGIGMRIGIIRRKDSDTMSYIASYVIPFAATAFNDIEQVVSLVIFLVVLCVVYVNTGMIHINPLLSILGYNLYEVEDDQGNSYFLMSKRRLRRGDDVTAIDVAESIFVEKKS